MLKSVSSRTARASIRSRMRTGVCRWALLALAPSVAATPAWGQDVLHWDVNGTSLGEGGTGTWDQTAPIWSLSTDGVSGPFGPWDNSALDDAVFAGTAGTVTVAAPITVHSIAFQTNAYTITGGTLTFGGVDPTLTVTTGSSTIASTINGTGRVIKAGAGTLTLSGNNSFAGGLAVNAGTLSLTGNNSFGSSPVVNGGTLSLAGTNSFTGNIGLNGGGLAASGAAALGSAGNNIDISASATLNVGATGGDLTGRTVSISGGSATVLGAGVGSAYFTGVGNLTAAGGGIILNNDANDYTGRTTFSGSGSFTSIGNLGETSSLGAPTTVANGTIGVTGGNSASTVASYIGGGDTSNRNWSFLSFARAAILSNSGTGTLTLTGDISVGSGSQGTAAQFQAATADLELLGVISGGNVTFNAFAGQSLILGNTNTYTGQTSIGGAGKVVIGTLANFGTASSLGTGGTASNISISGTLSYTGTGNSSNRLWSINNGTLSNDGDGALALSGTVAIVNTATLGGSYTGADNLVSGVISGAGNLRGAGAGTWVVSGANTYTGQTIVDSGTLRAGSATAFVGSKTFQVNGGTLDLNGFDQALTTLTGTGGTLALGGAKLTIDGPTGTTASFGGSITGSGGLTKTGNSDQTLTGASSYTGDTTIGGGTLALDFSAAGGPTSNIVGSGSTLVMTGGTLKVIGAANETDTQTFDGLSISAGNNTISAVSGSGTSSLTVNLGAITRTGGLMNFVLPTAGNIKTTNTTLGGWATVNGTDYAKVVGGNILAFTDADYTDKDNAANWVDNEFITDVTGFSGTVAGTKQLGGLRYTQPVSTTVTVSPGEMLGVDGTIIVAPTVLGEDQLITDGRMTGANGGVLGVQQNSTGNFTIASQIVDNGPGMGFTKAGTGLVSLTNTANSYTGATRVVQGTLAVTSIGNGGANSSIGASSAASSNLVLEGSTLRYTGTGDTSDRGFTFGKSGAILGAGVEVTDASANLVFSGLVTSTDGASFTKSGAGTLTLANPSNDFTGTVAVTGGLLAMNTLPSGGQVSPIGQSSSTPANLTLSGGGGLRYTGVTTATNRGFTLGTGGGAVDVSTLGAELTVSGQVVGAGSLTKNGAGTLILTAANTYAGGNVVNAGILRAGAANALGSNTGPMTLANTAGALLDLNNFNTVIGALNGGGASGGSVTLGSATLQINGGNGNYSGTISGTGGILRTGGGTQVFNGCNNSYTGPTQLQGAISTDCIRNGGQTSGIGASGSAPSNLTFTNGTLTYTGGDVVTDRGFQLAGGNGTIGVSNAGTTMTFTGNIIGAGNLIKAGAGELILSGVNSSTGNTTVSGGILRAGTTSAFGPQGGMTLGNTAGVLLDLDGYDTVVSYLSGGGAAGGNINLADAVLTINSTGNATYAGTISGSGQLIKNGTTIQTLNGCSSSFIGGVVINAGTLQVNCLANGGLNSSIGASSADPANLVINGTLQYTGAATSTDRQFTIGANGTTLNSSGTGPVAFTYAGPATMAGTGARTVTLTGTNTGVNLLAAQLDDSGAGVTSLAKTGAGTWRLSNQASTYTGATTISGGILIVDKLADGGQASTIGASSNAAGNLVIGNESTLRYVGTGDTTDRQFTLDTGVTYIQSSGTGALVFANTGTVGLTGTNATRTIALGGTNTDLNTMGGAIADNGTGKTTLAKNDSGTWVLTGNNSYTGNTVINDGNLMVGNGGTTGNAGAGNVIVNAPTSTLSLNRSDSFTFSGTLSGPGTLAQIGSGTSILTSALNTIGATTISAGALQVDGGLTTPTIAMTGTSALTVNGTVGAGAGIPAVLSGDGGASTVTVNAGGALTANGDLGDGADTVSLAGTLATGSAALSLGLGNDTLVLRDGAAITGAGIDAGTGTDALIMDNALAYTLDSSRAAGFESLAKQNSGVLTLTGDHAYSDGTTIAAGTLRVGNGGTSGALAGDITDNATLEFNRSGTLMIAGQISGTGTVRQLGPGTTVLTAANTYAGGTTITTGTLQIGDGGTTGSITGDVANSGTLVFNRSDDLVFDGVVSGTGALRKLGAGTLTLTADNSYTGLTTIAAGTLKLGDGGTSGSLAGNVLDNGALVFDRSDTVSFTGFISGAGSVEQAGSGTTILTGANGYAGATNVIAGTLLVNGDQSAATGATGVASGATLGGSGTIGGDVVVAGGGTLAPGSNGVGGLTINGNLSLAGTSRLDFQLGQANAPGSPLNDALTVGGDLILDGTLDVSVSPGGSFDIGLYRVVSYGGALNDQGLAIGTMPPGADVFVQTAIAGQVNLINTGGATLNFWDGAAGPKFDDAVNGGSGTWRNGSGNDNWTEVSGAVNASWADGAVAIFSAMPGTVTVDDSIGAVAAAGMQFASNGYRITGDALTLVDPLSVIRVGDGTAAGAGYAATIDAALVGAGAKLVKTDLGTLVLGGTNSYGGGTLLEAGTLSISSDANLGDAAGVVGIVDATLKTTADIATGRTVGLNDRGIFATDALTTLTLNGVVSGTGALVKSGDGALILAAANSYDGGTTVNAGILQIGDGGTTGSITGDVVDDASLVFNRADGVAFDGAISGTGSLTKLGAGVLTLTADNSFTGTATIAAGTLRLGASGTTGGVAGDVADNGWLIFDRGNQVNFAGLISGTGTVEQSGSGTTILTAANSYAGPTIVSGGALLINGDQSAATGDTTVSPNAMLGGIGIIGGNVLVANGATLAPGDATGPGTLAINGNLGLSDGSHLAYDFGQSNVVGGPLNDLTKVGGNLTLDGTIDVTLSPGGSFDVGLYRVISYGGALDDQGLALGTMPPGSVVGVQTSVAGQVNLVNSAGATVNFWDGGDPANQLDGAVNGGDGVWQANAGNHNWADITGAFNNGFNDASFAIFAAAPGTVQVDNDLGQVTASGMQFASDGYVIDGGALALTPGAVIRVGDGTADGANYTATIATTVTGAGDVTKTDLGKLVLTGASSYAGDVYVRAGELQLSGGGTLDNVNGLVGPLAGDQAIVTVTGPGSIWTNSDTLWVGYDGNGTLNISDGGKVISNSAMLGASTGVGQVVVTGSGSSWQNTGQLTIGADGAGDLRIENGATVSDTSATVGASGHGDAVVTGSGSTWINTGQLTIGSFASGTLRIEDGASVTSNQGYIGADGGSDSSVTVTGTGSTWLVTTFNITIGNNANGSLTIEDGARVRSQSPVFLGSSAGTSGTLTLQGSTADRGVLETSGLQAGLGTANVTLDGGLLRATQDNAGFFNNFGTQDVALGANGGVIDTNGHDIGVAPRFIGAGGLTKGGAGTLTLTGDSSYAGATDLLAGTLLVNGDQTAATGLTTVAAPATLGGIGTIGGSVDMTAGGTLAPGSGGVGTLAINGNLVLGAGSILNFEFGEAGVAGGALNDLVTVGGNLTLDGTINVSVPTGGSFGPGIYRVFDYGGTLTDNGLTLGTLPAGSAVSVQTAIAGQVNLVNSAGLTLSFWDGDIGPKNNGLVDGGNGVWRIGGANNNWTGSDGAINADYAQNSFAIFAGAPGTVTVDNGGDVQANGMQFASDGYRITGGPLTLTGTQATVQVGDSSAASAGYTATISADLTGTAGLVKTDAGTLILTGNNSYAGGNAINGGTLQVSSVGNLGGLAGGLSFDNGTLHTTGNINTTKAVTLAGTGTLLTDDGTLLVLGGTFSGAGNLVKSGAGTLLLAGTNSYLGGTAINGGTVQVAQDVNLGDASGGLSFDGGTLSVMVGFTTARDIDLVGAGTIETIAGTDMTLAGQITGAGAFTIDGPATVALAADNSYTGGTTIADGTLQLGTGGTTGSIVGDVANNGTLVFNRSDVVTFGGTISGGGALSQIGTGTTILTADNSYTGTTSVAGGTLLVNGDQSAATGLTQVLNGGTLGGTGTIGGGVTVLTGGTIAPGESAGTLTINGPLALLDGARLAFEFGQANVPGGPLNDLIEVGGNLTLDGTIDVTQAPGGSFGPGVYRVINYAGTLIDNGLSIGAMPAGSQAFVQTAIANQVNLVNTAGLTLNFWDGPVGPKNDGLIQGGDGTWTLGGGANDWTEVNGAVNADYAQGSFAIFQGTGGTVTVDNGGGDVLAAGMQFTSDGYAITGQPLTLTGAQAFVRVGDGSASDSGITTRIDAVLQGSAQLVKDRGGTLVLTGANTYTGGTLISEGTLQLGAGGTTGSVVGDIVDNGTLVVNRADSFTLGGTISGSGALIKESLGTLTLTADNSYAGGTTIADGALQLGDGGTTGSITGNVVDNSALRFNRSDDYNFAGTISGSGDVEQRGSGTLILTGSNSYAGATRVLAGTLLVNGDQTAASGLTSVASGAALGGIGTIGGDVAVADGATLAPGAGGAGALTINGSLALSGGSRLAYDFGAANAPGDPLNDVVNVGGDLTLDGTIDVAVTPGGSFDIGLYRIANYGGALTDNGLAIGTMPAGADVFVQTSVANQVNLINTGSAVLNFWDGGALSNRFDDRVEGGDGMWRAASDDSWTEMTGAVNAPYDNGAFAIFTGTGGLVTIDNSLGAVSASGLQFAATDYRIRGDALTLTGPQSVIRVGDGTAAGLRYTSMIDAVITGAAQLVKTDLGTLVLTGTNSYTGGTAIDGGTVRISADANLGDGAGGLSFDGGTLNTTADLASARAVDLAGQGMFATEADTTLTLTGSITGAGPLGKTGAGTLVLAGAGSYTGGIEVVQGGLFVNGDHAAATGPVNMNQGTTLGGTGTIGGDVNLGGTLAPGMGGVGTLTINGDLTISQTATLAYEFGQANAAGGALNDLVTVGGDLTLDGTIDVTVPAGGAFEAGVYRVFDYGGALIDNGLTLGAMPAGSTVAVQTSIAGQVNLVNSAGLALSFWDGAAGPKNNGAVNGGTGTWQNTTGNDNWTDANGAVNAAYSDGAFAVFEGTAGTVTVDNGLGAVTASGMQFAANGYTITGDSVTLTGPQATIRVGDGSMAGAAFTATIDTELSGGTQLVKTDAGTLVLKGANSYTGGTAINGGTVRIASDASLGAASGNVTLDGGTLATSATLSSARTVTLAGAGTIATADATLFTLDGALAGTGALTKAGAGTLLLTGDSSGYAGATTVSAGTLAVIGKLGGAVAIDAGARLEGTGSVGGVTNAGTVAPGLDGFGTLTINGGYGGSGGMLEIEAALGGDGSETDRLVVTGGTAGTTQLAVVNRGGLGGQTVEGIKIVDVTGGASDGIFTLKGDYMFEGDQAVIAGAYGYRLYKGGVATPADGDWYLRSALLDPPDAPETPLYQPGVPIYETYLHTLQTLNGLPTLQQRVGNRQWSGFTNSGVGMWGRMESTRYRPEAAVSTTGADLDVNTWDLQVGFDTTVAEPAGGALIAGVNGRYGTADARVRSRFGNGSIDTERFAIGGTLTWYGADGFYADAQAQRSWYNSNLKSGTLGPLVRGNDGWGESYSLELGQRLPVDKDLSLTPQAQIVYSSVRFRTFTDPAGAIVSAEDGDSLRGRLGLSLDHQRSWTQGSGGTARTHFYAIANLQYEMLDGNRVDVSGTPLLRRDDRLWGELGIGGSYSWADGRFTLFSEASVDTALSNFGDSNGVRGNAGFRMKF